MAECMPECPNFQGPASKPREPKTHGTVAAAEVDRVLANPEEPKRVPEPDAYLDRWDEGA